ncbi:2'-5' RNA ligase family protein [Nonomuraea sp. C10]|uniref:2'-5' RNA ligase family protein n=1 Tax=Nonomuraea sp. C10 TaxID=2600577 RepID=UPI0011CD8D28|nr:2'-5' RNA ligase family protein [Nonomuraea sp. C10]TXK43268.1 2'-5' RNA ligase family protein [Nonomuraea sp. C10]
MSSLPTRMADCWERRRPQDRLYWQVLLGDDPGARAIVQEAHDRLAGVPGLDRVPPESVHLTTFVAGRSDEITGDQVRVMAQEAAGQLARVEPFTVTLGRVLYHPESVALEARPVERLRPLLEAAKFATRAATGRDGVLDHEPWTPRVTLAYSNSDGPAAPVIDALGERLPDREVTIRSIHIVDQEAALSWRPVAEVRLGAS